MPHPAAAQDEGAGRSQRQCSEQTLPYQIEARWISQHDWRS